MDNLRINKINKVVNGNIEITGSKSETNRLLILKQFYNNIEIENGSNSDDSRVLEKALSTSSNTINVGHAGTAMRFLTAYFAQKEGCSIILTGSERMKNRPIKILVDALKTMGASIDYVEKEGYPPLKITGKKIQIFKVSINGNVSSQYISALILIAPNLDQGLEIQLNGEVTSVPYIQMTLNLLKQLGISFSWEGNIIKVYNKKIVAPQICTVESDWSAASYFYSLVALSTNAEVTLASFKNESLQGDAVLADIYKNLGVSTHFSKNKITLKNTGVINNTEPLKLDLQNAPDIAQTIAVTCLGLGKSCFLTGLHTLKIKETDRLLALKTEIEKLGGKVTITNNSLHLEPTDSLNANCCIATYDDHRMAMAFAPLATKVPIEIEDFMVVSKSYPQFWADFNTCTR
jgi:3-phosphoshikimate 1-carboxyvinyltransferase